MPRSRTPSPDNLRPEPTRRSSDPPGFQARISIQRVLRVARWVSSNLPRLESLHTEKLCLIPQGCYWFWLSLTWRFSLLFHVAFSNRHTQHTLVPARGVT